MRGHDRLAALSNLGTDVMVPHAGHFVQLDQPAVVIAQVEAVIGALRK